MSGDIPDAIWDIGSREEIPDILWAIGDRGESPYVLEFLGLEERAAYSESDLESAIIDKLEHFLLELGKGFLFEARQRRLTALNDVASFMRYRSSVVNDEGPTFR